MILKAGVKPRRDQNHEEDRKKPAAEARSRQEDIADGRAPCTRDDDERRAQAGPGGHAQGVGGCERILEDGLDDGPARREGPADQEGAESPRDPDLPEN